MRLVQHKREAFWFYRFLSIFYDKLVNPLFWTRWMRDQSLELAHLDQEGIKVIDVGCGTGFTTQGIVKKVSPASVICMDQSPHQLAKAKRKQDLTGCTFIVGDAENIPMETDSFDRYISAGSIEYWPNPQQGINESYRVIKPEGIALLIGPLQPKTGFARLMANTWMLFPTEEEYRSWYENAGFTNIAVKYIQPHWYKDKDGYGLAISGTKPAPGISPNPAIITESETNETEMNFGRYIKLIWRVLVGSTAGFVFIPIALLGYLVNSFKSQDTRPAEYIERLNRYQIAVIIIILGIPCMLLWVLFS